MTRSRHITIYTILGSLPFISKLHLESIKEAADKNISIVAFGGRSIEADHEFIELLDAFHIEYKLFSREKHDPAKVGVFGPAFLAGAFVF